MRRAGSIAPIASPSSFVIIEVANAGSINKAAGNLFITQPSLSSAIAELETEIGVKLFSRNNRGIFLTPEGSEFVGYARQVVEQFDLIEAKYIAASIANDPRHRRHIPVGDQLVGGDDEGWFPVGVHMHSVHRSGCRRQNGKRPPASHRGSPRHL